MITAIVNENKKGTRGGPPTWYLHISKKDRGLPKWKGQPVPITLVISGEEYAASMSTRANFTYYYISPGLEKTVNGMTVKCKLATALGWEKGKRPTRVNLSVSGDRIEIV